MDIVDLLVLIVVLAILGVLFVQIENRRRFSAAPRITCVSNLKQINLALRVWQTDHSPETISTDTNIPPGLNSGQLAWVRAMGLTNILNSTKILHCPADTENPPTNPAFPVRISYFFNLDASETYPQMILDGDDNLVIGDGKHLRPTDNAAEGDVPVKPGILELTTNTFAWDGKRHVYVGNVGFADGSVAEESASGLETALQYNFNGTPWTTNHWAIP